MRIRCFDQVIVLVALIGLAHAGGPAVSYGPGLSYGPQAVYGAPAIRYASAVPTIQHYAQAPVAVTQGTNLHIFLTILNRLSPTYSKK